MVEYELMTLRAKVFAAINASPNGITTKQLAKRFNGNEATIASYASKMAAYGKISHESIGRKRPGVPSLWKSKVIE